MTSSNPLSLDFLIRKPEAAAQVLQSLEDQEAAFYLREVPVRIVAPVLQEMQMWPASRILDQLSLEQNAAIFAQLTYRTVAALMRLQQRARRTELLAVLPAKLARSLSVSLVYQENTVGAWMDMSTPGFYPELTAGECLGLLKNSEDPFGTSLVMINQSHQVVGMVPLDRLLASPDEQTLGQLMDSEQQPLAAEMSIQIAANLSDWHRYHSLPVRNVSGVYLGTVTRSVLRTALEERSTEGSSLGDSLLSHLARAMIATATGMMQLAPDSHSHGWSDTGAPHHDS